MNIYVVIIFFFLNVRLLSFNFSRVITIKIADFNYKQILHFGSLVGKDT